MRIGNNRETSGSSGPSGASGDAPRFPHGVIRLKLELARLAGFPHIVITPHTIN